MTEPNNPQTPPAQNSQPNQPTSPPADQRERGGQIDENAIPAEWRWLYAEMKQARKEAGDFRAEKNTLQKQITEAEQKKLVEQGEWQKLAEQRQAELEKIKVAAELGKQYQDALKATNDQRIAAIPKERQALIPTDYDPVKLAGWLDKNQHLLVNKPQAPNLNGGEGSTGSNTQPNIDLTADELLVAKSMGLTAEQYAKQKPAKK